MMERKPNKQLIIVTGMSGSGKSIVSRTLEDMGFFCIDNLPLALFEGLIELLTSEQIPFDNFGLVMDARDPKLFEHGQEKIEKVIKEHNLKVRIIFLDCSDEILIRRYKETRRKHPMALDDTVSKGIEIERTRLGWIRNMADFKVNSSELNIHQLQVKTRQLLALPGNEIKFNFQFISFGFKYGLPSDADIVMDVRFLPNPHWVDHLRPKTGKSSDVSDYIFSFSVAEKFLESFTEQIKSLVPYYSKEGKSYLTIAIGCTGGKHRSVVVSEALAQKIVDSKLSVTVYHRDIAKSE